jgi:hypothetical protein
MTIPCPKFEKLGDLTDEEVAAVQSYAAESPRLHHLMQGRDAMGCPAFESELRKDFRLLPLISSATRKRRLLDEAILFAGFGNGYAAVGSLWHSEPDQLVGLVYEYGGFFSTSVDEQAARRFLEAGDKRHSVFLTIRARPGLLALPMSAIGPNNHFEGEVLVSPAIRFRVIGARRGEAEGGTPFLDLDLETP